MFFIARLPLLPGNAGKHRKSEKETENYPVFLQLRLKRVNVGAMCRVHAGTNP